MRTKLSRTILMLLMQAYDYVSCLVKTRDATTCQPHQRLLLFCLEMVLLPKDGTLSSIDPLMGIILPESIMVILHICLYIMFCYFHMAIMAGTRIFIIVPPSAQTFHQTEILPMSVKLSTLHFGYILAMVNTPPFIAVDDSFNSTLLICGPPQIKRVSHTLGSTKVDFRPLCTVAWKTG
jgi:hypothetical protein